MTDPAPAFDTVDTLNARLAAINQRIAEAELLGPTHTTPTGTTSTRQDVDKLYAERDRIRVRLARVARLKQGG